MNEAIFAEGRQLEEEVERAKENAGKAELWRYADWLVETFPNGGAGGDQTRDRAYALPDWAAESRYSLRFLQEMRATAAAFPVGTRIADKAITTHRDALRLKGNVEDAIAYMTSAAPARLVSYDVNAALRVLEEPAMLEDPKVRGAVADYNIRRAAQRTEHREAQERDPVGGTTYRKLEEARAAIDMSDVIGAFTEYQRKWLVQVRDLFPQLGSSDLGMLGIGNRQLLRAVIQETKAEQAEVTEWLDRIDDWLVTGETDYGRLLKGERNG